MIRFLGFQVESLRGQKQPGEVRRRFQGEPGADFTLFKPPRSLRVRKETTTMRFSPQAI